MEKYWDLMHYVCSYTGDTPISSGWAGVQSLCFTKCWRQGYGHYVLHNAVSRGMIILFYIMLSWGLLVLMGVWPKKLPEYARPTRKVAQRCANWLVSPHSHVWAVCRVYDTHPSYPLGQYRRKIDWNDQSRHCIRMFLHLIPIAGSLAEYFFKYSSHVLLHFSG